MTEIADASSGRATWPSTRWTVILGASEPGGAEWAASWEALAQLYWSPVYGHVRYKWGRSRDEALDLTQDFFAWLLESQPVAQANPGRGRFRAFLRVCLDNFLRDDGKRCSRLKRGGGILNVSLDALPEDPPSLSEDPLDREWKRVVLERAAARMESDFL